MAELWYYTNEGKQMDAVSIRELKQLVGEGVLKPTDMVWKEGLPRWVRASSLKELFPEPTSTLDKYFSNSGDATTQNPQTTGVSAPSGSKAVPTPAADEDEPRERKRRRETDESDESRRRSRRRPEPTATSGSGSGMLVLAFVGIGGLVLLAVLCGGIGILLYDFKPAPQPQPPVAQNKQDVVKPINDGKNNEKPPPKKDDGLKDGAPLQEPPLPKDVLTGSGLASPPSFIPPGRTLDVKFQVKAGYAARIPVNAIKATSSLTLTVVRENGNAEIARTDRPAVSSIVNFNLPDTEIIVVRIKNESKSSPKCRVVYDVSPK